MLTLFHSVLSVQQHGIYKTNVYTISKDLIADRKKKVATNLFVKKKGERKEGRNIEKKRKEGEKEMERGSKTGREEGREGRNS